MAIRVSLTVLFFILVSVATTPILNNNGIEDKKERNTVANKFFHSIPEQERSEFLKLSLVLGLRENWPAIVNQNQPPPRIPQDLRISEDLFEKFRDMDTPPLFRRNIVLWFMNKFHLSPLDVMRFCLRDHICLPDGTCFNTGDTGDLCCPF